MAKDLTIDQLTPSALAKDVRKLLAEETKVARWSDNRYWNEFLVHRRNFLSGEDLKNCESVEGKEKLEAAFINWVKSPENESMWWVEGGWIEHPQFAMWHISQFLRAKAKTIKPKKDHIDSNDQEGTITKSNYWDPARPGGGSNETT